MTQESVEFSSKGDERTDVVARMADGKLANSRVGSGRVLGLELDGYSGPSL